MNKHSLTVLFLLCFFQSWSQVATDTATTKDKALKVFLDCPYCDMDYMRTEITFISYVRDRMEAQVDVIVSMIATGSGGTEYTLVFKGQKEFTGKSDTLKFDVKSFETADGIRKETAQILKLGLARYIARTPYCDKVCMSFLSDSSKGAAAPIPIKDPWHSWVYSANVYGNINSQDLTNFFFVSGSLSASKVTPEWKISLSVNASYNKNSYDIGPGILTSDSIITSSTKSESFNGQYVKSISQHFSWGINGSASTSTYSNLKLQERLAPGLEYSIFPYSQATHRQLTLLYSIYGSNTQYIDTTIYGVIKQTLYGESLTLASSFKQPWGSLNMSVSGSHYFYDLSKNNLSCSLSLNLNIFQGFSINLYGSASLVHDQLYLPATGATTDEILLQVKALATSYYFFSGVGLTYTFGSIYNNVVNPRFGGSGGNTTTMTFSN
jgi:hypothetical protein